MYSCFGYEFHVQQGTKVNKTVIKSDSLPQTRSHTIPNKPTSNISLPAVYNISNTTQLQEGGGGRKKANPYLVKKNSRTKM
jgi:hypothetical protein